MSALAWEQRMRLAHLYSKTGAPMALALHSLVRVLARWRLQ